MEVLAKLEFIFHHVKEYGNRGSTNCWKVEGRGEREGERGGREGRERGREREKEEGEGRGRGVGKEKEALIKADSKLCKSHDH